MSSVAGAREVHHAVEAGVGCTIALISVRVQLLLGEHVTAILVSCNQLQCMSKGAKGLVAECALVEGHQ
jgi:hypothetical protein